MGWWWSKELGHLCCALGQPSAVVADRGLWSVDENCQGANSFPVRIFVLRVWWEVVASRAYMVAVMPVRQEAEHVVGSGWPSHVGGDGVIADLAGLVATGVCACVVPRCRVSVGAPTVREGCLAMVAYVVQADMASCSAVFHAVFTCAAAGA